MKHNKNIQFILFIKFNNFFVEAWLRCVHSFLRYLTQQGLNLYYIKIFAINRDRISLNGRQEYIKIENLRRSRNS